MINVNLSIIIPIYNNPITVGECIEGALSQLDKCEIICVDDGSTDNSAEIVEDFARKDSRIRLIKQNNQGSGAARNVGIKAAKGEYIAFMDADDYYPSNDILSRLYKAAKANNALICGGSFMTDESGTIVDKFDGDMAGNTFEKEGWVNFSKYQFDYSFYRFIYNRQFLIKNKLFFPNYRRYQDPPFMLHAFSAAGKFYAIPDVTYCYRINKSSVNWTVTKIYDLLCGLEDNLVFSAQHKLEKVHILSYLRLCNDFCGPIVNTAIYYDSGGKILNKLINIQSVADRDILTVSRRFTLEEISCSKPLLEIINFLSNQNVQLKREGWYINKKIFRIYTLPVRTIGKLLRKFRKRK